VYSCLYKYGPLQVYVLFKVQISKCNNLFLLNFDVFTVSEISALLVKLCSLSVYVLLLFLLILFVLTLL
jgi:hypothetical protein